MGTKKIDNIIGKGLQNDLISICDILNNNPLDNVKILREYLDEYIEMREVGEKLTI